ncbi:MAG: hypothetical protein ACP6IU_13445 [Candidatus Asgardarchaeia archaeon]
MLIESLIITVLIFSINFGSLIDVFRGNLSVRGFIKKTVHPKRWFFSFVGLFLWAFIYFLYLPILWYFVALLVARVFFLPFDGIRARFVKERSGKYRLSEAKITSFFVLSLVLSMIVIGSSFYFLGVDRPVANATYFNTLITQAGSEPFFKNEIPHGKIRLVTPELAQSIAEQHLSSFGSNMEVKSVHVAIINDSLMWVVAVGSTNTIAENYIAGLVLINATDPFADPILVNQRFTLGEGLFLYNDIRTYSYEKDPMYSYGRAFITRDPNGEWVYVVTKIDLGADLIARPAGIVVYNTDGTLIGEYTIENVPEWIPQIYDEDWIESKISEWGEYKRGNTFDYWAGGFLWIEPSRDRVAISEDLRYIQSPDTGKMQGIVTVHPYTSDRTLAGLFVINISGIFYYDYREYSYISGRSAMSYVESKLTQPAQGYYYATMPLLYPITVNGKLRLAWFVPVYWAQYTDEEEETGFIKFAGLGIVDAKDPSYIIVNTEIQGLNGPEIVEATKNMFKGLFGEVTQPSPTNNTVEITANVTSVYSYIQDGMTHIVLELNNATYQYIEGTPESLNATQWYELLKTQPGDTIRATIQKTSDGRWLIIAFENLSR